MLLNLEHVGLFSLSLSLSLSQPFPSPLQLKTCAWEPHTPQNPDITGIKS
jgi:hypothetical protein